MEKVESSALVQNMDMINARSVGIGNLLFYPEIPNASLVTTLGTYAYMLYSQRTSFGVSPETGPLGTAFAVASVAPTG